MGLLANLIALAAGDDLDEAISREDFSVRSPFPPRRPYNQSGQSPIHGPALSGDIDTCIAELRRRLRQEGL